MKCVNILLLGVGAFLTPRCKETGSTSVGLFMHISLIDISVLIVAFIKLHLVHRCSNGSSRSFGVHTCEVNVGADVVLR